MTDIKQAHAALEKTKEHLASCVNYAKTFKQMGQGIPDILIEQTQNNAVICVALKAYIEREQGAAMKTMGLIGVLCDCSVQVDEETREQIEHAISDNLPENWSIKRVLDSIEVEFVGATEQEEA